MKIGRHSHPLPPASSADPSVTRQQNGPQAVPIAAPRGLPLRQAAGDGPALSLNVKASSLAPAAPPAPSSLPPSVPVAARQVPVAAARALSSSRVRQVSPSPSDRASPHSRARVTIYPLQDMLDDSRREREYYLTHRLRYADRHLLWPQTFHTLFGGKRCEASGQNTLDIALEVAQGIKRRGLLDGLAGHALGRDIVRRDLHYRRRTADSPAQLARVLLNLDLINGVLTLGEAHALSGRLVTSPACQALNVIVFADHLYLLDAPHRHYQHLTLPCDTQSLTITLRAFLPQTTQSPAPYFHLHHIGFF